MLKYALGALSLAVLSGCGGSSSDDNKSQTTSPNKAPIVTVTDMTVMEKENVTLVSNAIDSDGTIASYKWQQTAGVQVALTNDSADTLQFTAPAITEDQLLTFNLTVTDDDGATATSDVSVTVEPILIPSFAITGEVTSGSPMVNADITVKIGDLALETQSNELGRYSLLLNLDDDYLDDIMTITATGSSTDSAIKLVSIVGDVASIAQLAEENENVLSHQAHHGLLVSHLSSAAAILMQQENDGKEIATLDELYLSEKYFSSELILPYASMIKYLTEHVSNIPNGLIPINYTNNYHYFLNNSYASELYEAIVLTEQNLFNNIEKDIFSEKEALSLHINISETTSFFTSMGKVTFKPDFSGTLISALDNDSIYYGTRTFSWVRTNKGIELLFDEPVLIRQDYYWGTFASKYLKGYTLNWIYKGHYRDELLIEDEMLFVEESNGIPFWYDEEVKFKAVKAIKETAINQSFTNIIQSNTQYLIDMNRPHITQVVNSGNGIVPFKSIATKLNFDSLLHNTMEIELTNVDSDEEFQIEKRISEWQFNSNGELNITSNNLDINIVGLDSNEDKAMQIMSVAKEVNNGQASQVSRLGYIYKINPLLAWTNENVPGVYTYQSDLDSVTSDIGWYELRQDGTLSYISVSKGVTESGEIIENVYESPGLWKIINNELMIRRYRDNYDKLGTHNRCHSTIWQTSFEDDCLMYVERRWEAIQNQTTQNEIEHNFVLQHGKFYQMEYQNISSISDLMLVIISDWITDFVRATERPVTLPEDYVLIKDRVGKMSTSANAEQTDLQLMKEELLH